MSEEKPKYIRKKCPHNKYKFQCRDCGSKAYCDHNILKYFCKDCQGDGICSHNRIKQNCTECKNAASICEHRKRRSRCLQCSGGSTCTHNKLKSRCTLCNGNSLCAHNKRKEYCVTCLGSQICEHKIRKDRCITCGGSSLCIHGKDKSICIECEGKNICPHNKIRYQCVTCEGGRICPHKKRKSHCKTCGGSALCKTELCETVANPRYEGYCLNCFIHVFPDKPNARNYKTKETAVKHFVLEKFPLEKYTWVADKRVQDGCSRRRPDLLLDLGYQIIVVEVDENQHEDYDCSCENKRLMELSQDVHHRPLIFIRFNPDDYTTKTATKTTKVTSCWGINKQGICAVKKTKEKEWTTRLEALKIQIEYWCKEENKTDKTIEIIQLFYDNDL
jgi:hypothetical protein